jgi:hypothetical protein
MRTMMRKMRSRHCGTALALALGLVLLAAVQAGAVAPMWRVDAVANTTVVPGGQVKYLMEFANTGGTRGGPALRCNAGVVCTLQITIPAGLTAVSFLNDVVSHCTGLGVPGPTVVTCDSSFGFASIQPHFSRWAGEALTAQVDPSASGSLTTSFAMYGGQDSTGVAVTRADGSTCDAAPPGVPCARTAATVEIASAPPGAGIQAFDGQVASDAVGTPFTQAGGHPYSASTSIDFNTVENPNPFIGALWPVEPAKDVVVDLPAGFIGNPTAAAKCSASDLAGAGGGTSVPKPLCSPSSQVGTVLVRAGLAFFGFDNAQVFGPVPVYNMVPPAGVPGRFGFNVAGTVVTLDAKVRNGSDYGIVVNASDVGEGIPIAGTTFTFWGVPSDPSHDGERGCAGQTEPFDFNVPGPSCPSSEPRVAFLRNPTSCAAPSGASPSDGLITTAHLDTWAQPGARDAEGNADPSDPRWKPASFVSHVPPAYPDPPSSWGAHQLPTGCDRVPFDPTLSGAPVAPAAAGSPAGFVFDVSLPQSDDPGSIGEADLRKAVVKLPEGMRVSPASAGGLGACSPDQIQLHSGSDPTCPDSSKLGDLTIKTPLLEAPLSGAVYLATPHDNPFGSLIAIYLVAKGPGVVVKLAGKVETDAHTGQVTAAFDDNPQTPVSDVHIVFKGGPRAPLVLPTQCGTYTTHSELTSWSGKTVGVDSSFDVSADGNGAPCPPTGFSPGFTAGTMNPVAGSDSSFLLRLTRGDRDQELSGLTVDMPGGLLGRIANAVLCPDGAANAGGCVDGSKIGDVTVGAGAGSNPFYISSGRAYVTGPYKGAPYGLSIVVPAVAGPFDLGNVVVRAAIFVDRNTAALKVVSDPLPTILQGIPLDVRDVRVSIDKPHFIVNPTSCAEKHVGATVKSTQGAIAHVSDRFQAVECANLKLAPKLTLTVGARRHTRAGVSTPVTATLTQGKGQTNLRSVSVTLPGSLNALLPVVNRACKLAEFEAGHCTNKTKVGTAVAVTPLLRDPLRGSAYFVKNPARVLPDLMVALRGQIAIDVTGKVSIPGGKRLATTFDTIPDAPITKFTLRVVSGVNGPVGIVTNLCSPKGRAALATIGFRGQNGALLRVTQRARIEGCSTARASRGAHRGRR